MNFARLAGEGDLMSAEHHLRGRPPEPRSQVVLVEDASKAFPDHLYKWRVHDTIVHVSQGQAGWTAGHVTCITYHLTDPLTK